MLRRVVSNVGTGTRRTLMSRAIPIWRNFMKDKRPPGFEKWFKGGSKKGGKKSKKGGSGSEEGGGFDNEGKVLTILFGGFVSVYILYRLSSKNTDLSYQELVYSLIPNHQVTGIVIDLDDNTAKVHITDKIAFSTHPDDVNTMDQLGMNHLSTMQTKVVTFSNLETFQQNLIQAQKDLGIDPKNFIPIDYSRRDPAISALGSTFSFILTLGMGVMLISFMFSRMTKGMGGRGGPAGMFGAMTNVAKRVKPEDVNVAFADVAGLDEAKAEIMEFVEFLKNPDKFTRLGAKTPKGALLVGPPGTGKTLLAKATAGEAEVPFFSITGSDFVELYVGMGASRVRELFKEARKNSPCIIFIDEIDAVGKKRSKRSESNDERESTLNQLLVEMDGFNADSQVVVLAGTNRHDVLDSALLRPGRFDRQITIDKPDIRGRREIYKVYLKKVVLGDVSIEEVADRLAALTPGFAGADIANVVNESAIIAARQDKNAIQMIDFESAVDRVIGGLEKPNKVMSPAEKRRVAYHEAGHAVCGWFLEHASPLLKVTIVPRGSGALGYAQYLPNELNLMSGEEMHHTVCMALGGRVAEELFIGNISTGAANDLEKVTNIIYSQISVYGMNDKIGNVSFPEKGQFSKPYSEATAQIMDEEAKKMVDKAYQDTTKLLEDKKEMVKALAEKLLAIETINHEQIVEVLGDRPFTTPTYNEFLVKSKEIAQAKKDLDAKVEQDAAEIEEGTTEPVDSDVNSTDKVEPVIDVDTHEGVQAEHTPVNDVEAGSSETKQDDDKNSKNQKE